MTDDTQQQEHHSRRFIKGVHRAFFSPIDPEDIQVTPSMPQPPPPQPQVVPQPMPVTPPPVAAPQPVFYPAAQQQAPQPQPAPIAQAAAYVPPAPPPVVQQPAVHASAAPPQQKVSKPKRKGSVAKFVFFMLLGIVIAGAGGYSFYMYWSSQQQLAQLQKASPQEYQILQDEALVRRVGRHMLLPNETPLVRTLEGVDQKTRNDPFFANAKDGDKVLVFSKRAILYDPELDKIIEVGAIRQVIPTPEMVQNATASGSPSVAGAATVSGKILLHNEKP